MKVIIPTAAMSNYVATTWWEDGVQKTEMLYWPLVSVGTVTDMNPGIFIQGHEGKTRDDPNSVLHVKLVNATTILPVEVDGNVCLPYYDGMSHHTKVTWYAVARSAIVCQSVGGPWENSTRRGWYQRRKITASFTSYRTGGNKYGRVTFGFALGEKGLTFTGEAVSNTELQKAIARVLQTLPDSYWDEVQGSDMWQVLNNRVTKWMAGHLKDILPYSILNVNMRYTFRSGNVSPLELQPPPLLFEELARAEGYPFIRSMSNYWVTLMKQHAFLMACESVPRLNDNSIANIIEIVSFIKGLVIDHEVEIPKSLTSAWLAYRYQYQTTKLDAEEAIKFMDRHVDEYLKGSGLKVYGQHSIDYRGVNVLCRCTLKVRERELDILQGIWSALSKYGLAPDFYLIWDMVPYSFIVDWFIPMGDILNVVDASQLYNEEHYDFIDIVYSTKYNLVDDKGLEWSVYRRWIEGNPPKLSGYYWFEDAAQATKKTWYKRALDAVSLICGKKGR